MFAISDDEYNEDQSRIPVFIILAMVGYYSPGRYEKIPCRTSSLSGNTYKFHETTPQAALHDGVYCNVKIVLLDDSKI